jgi:polyphosphate kinase
VQQCSQSSPEELETVDRIFREQIFPALTPLAVGPGRPFPYISNLSLSIAVWLRDPVTEAKLFARVKVPKEVLPRFVDIGGCTLAVEAHAEPLQGGPRRPRLALALRREPALGVRGAVLGLAVAEQPDHGG